MTDNGRAAGILAHPTSFPTAFGIGDLGPTAHRFVDWLADGQQQVWQLLPLSPTGIDGSPYKSPSAFAGNPLLISPEGLLEDDLVDDDALQAAAISLDEEASPVDFARVGVAKRRLLDGAYARFQTGAGADDLQERFADFCRSESGWLNRHSSFMALSDANETNDWLRWDRHLDWARSAIESVGSDAARLEAGPLADRFGFHRFAQFVFYRQWQRLRDHAHKRGVHIFGDIPIYVSHQSADVWGNRDLFELDEAGRPVRVAGVPPDYFSSTGQLWGNPLYDWQRMATNGYAWWNSRVQAVLHLFDLVRLDHFRGFEAYWAVPADEENAVRGEWIQGPGDELLASLQRTCAARGQQAPVFGCELPIVAEDLGLITEGVTALRKRFQLPGMSVLQFAFGSEPDARFLPDRIATDTVAYTGTHDNNTTLGWYRDVAGREPSMVEQLARYLPIDADSVSWEMIRLAWESEARLAVAPLQDVFSLGSEARMNTPGRETGNWRWRFSLEQLTDTLQKRLANLTRQTRRS